jgi:archaellum component FlaC
MMTGPDDIPNRDILDALIGFQAAVAEKFDAVDARADGMRRDMNRRFDRVDRRFDEVDKRFFEVDKRFDEIDKRFDGLEARVKEIEPRRVRPQESD